MGGGWARTEERVCAGRLAGRALCPPAAPKVDREGWKQVDNHPVPYRPEDPDRALFDTPERAAMNAHRSPVRDGRTCDQCGLPNLPPGWYHAGWATYVDYPNSTSEGYGGLVLCGPCYAGHIERVEGPGPALVVLRELLRDHQTRVARARESRARTAIREPLRGPSETASGLRRRQFRDPEH